MELVFVSEKLKLQEINRDDLAQKVKWISRDSGDGFCYDILSYDIDKSGSVYAIHIEVKSTVTLNDDFIMSSNELKYAKENMDTYRLYKVVRVNSDNSVCKVIEVDFDELFASRLQLHILNTAPHRKNVYYHFFIVTLY